MIRMTNERVENLAWSNFDLLLSNMIFDPGIDGKL
jgi:hypothetical protein